MHITGTLNALALQSFTFEGDHIFKSPRRPFLQQLSGNRILGHSNVTTVTKRLKELPALGAAHVTDILNVFGRGDE
jgi:acetylcholinesterase